MNKMSDMMSIFKKGVTGSTINSKYDEDLDRKDTDELLDSLIKDYV